MPEVASIQPITPIQTKNLIMKDLPLTHELSSLSDSPVSSIASPGGDSLPSPPHSNRSSTSSNHRVSLSLDQLLDHSHLKPGKDASLLSYTQTINMYRENARKTDNPDIECDLAIYLIEGAKQGEHKKEYLNEAEKILKNLSIKGHANAQYHLGKLFAAGLLSKKGNPELDKAFSLFVQASKHCHADAANRAGQCYEKGLGCRINGPKAVQFYKKAASLGHPGAMFRLGQATMNGEMGLSIVPKDAVKWYTRSVEAVNEEYPQALHELANLHVNGIPNVVFVDFAYAVSLYNHAAELGYAPSAFKLGECYEYGKLDCEQNPALSIHYYTIAAEHGCREACFALTAWYLVGSPNILPQSDEKAYIWAKRAADLQLPKAEYAVGYFSEVGIGCVKNAIAALDWYKRAASHGDKRAQQKLQGISSPEKLPTQKKKRISQEDCTIM